MLRHALILSALMGATLLAVPQVMAQGTIEGLRICHDEDFALCAASTCTETGGMIEVVTAADTDTGTAFFPEAECTCPIFPGPGFTDVKGGNMGQPLGPGDCTPPTVVRGEFVGDDGIWSYYSFNTNIPQEITNWNTGKQKSNAPSLDCPASTPDMPNMNTFANCFAFACVRAGKIHGNVEVATCFCPIGESTKGTPIEPGSAFMTQAGQKNEDICPQLPVSAPLPIVPPPLDDG